jgi:outer membrane protein OmpA-like peptidoglycan-associated protein
MRNKFLGFVSFAILAALAVSPIGSTKAAEKIFTDEQIENKLFAKSKGISPARRTAIDMPAVTFEFNSANLTGSARRQLDVLGRVLSKRAFSRNRFIVGGHTDDVGKSQYNKDLSQKRAESVVEYLVSRHGLDKNALTPIGYGESRLLKKYAPDGNNQRRAEIINLGKRK